MRIKSASPATEQIPHCGFHPDATMRPILVATSYVDNIPAWECPECGKLVGSKLARAINGTIFLNGLLNNNIEYDEACRRELKENSI